jgi:LPXTG-motif cell wall-anchored protein
MKHKAATFLLAGGLALGFASSAHAGNITYYRECGPDGNTIVHITATNGNSTVYIDGIQTHMLVTTPGTHVVEWYGPATNGDGTTDLTRIVLWDRKTITIDPSNCQAAATTTTAAPTTSEAPPDSTALVPPSTIATASTVATAIDMDVDPCVTSDTGCNPPAKVTGTAQLPETGQNTTALVVAASALLTIGTTLVLVRRPS